MDVTLPPCDILAKGKRGLAPRARLHTESYSYLAGFHLGTDRIVLGILRHGAVVAWITDMLIGQHVMILLH